MRFQDRKLSLFVLDWNMENRGDSVKTSSGNVLTRQCIIYCAAAPVRDVNCEEGKLFIVTNQWSVSVGSTWLGHLQKSTMSVVTFPKQAC